MDLDGVGSRRLCSSLATDEFVLIHVLILSWVRVTSSAWCSFLFSSYDNDCWLVGVTFAIGTHWSVLDGSCQVIDQCLFRRCPRSYQNSLIFYLFHHWLLILILTVYHDLSLRPLCIVHLLSLILSWFHTGISVGVPSNRLLVLSEYLLISYSIASSLFLLLHQVTLCIHICKSGTLWIVQFSVQAVI